MRRDDLVALRRKARLSQFALAQRLGVSESAVQRWEFGDRQPDARNLLALAELYGVPPASLLPNKQSNNDDHTIDQLP